MRRLLVALSVLLILPLSASAWMSPLVCSGAPPGCSTPTGDVIYESFGDDSTACYSGASGNDATCLNTWTVSGDSVTFHAELPGSPPAGSCTYGILVDVADAAENGERIYIDTGDAISYETSTDIGFSLYVDAAMIDSNQNIPIVSLGENNAGSTYYCANIRLLNISGVLRLYAYGSTQVYQSISTDTWYTVFVHLDGTAASSYFTIDGGEHNDFTRYDKNKEYLSIGALTNLNDGESASFYIGYIYVDNP